MYRKKRHAPSPPLDEVPRPFVKEPQTYFEQYIEENSRNSSPTSHDSGIPSDSESNLTLTEESKSDR